MMKPLLTSILTLITTSQFWSMPLAQADGIQPLELNVFLRQWHVLGPFPKASEDSSGIDEVFFPEEAKLQSGFARLYDNSLFLWKPFDRPMVEFRRVLSKWNAGGSHVVAYAYTEFVSDKEQELLLGIAHDDEVRGWLNGQEFCFYAERLAAVTDSKLERVTVQKGVNRLLLKVGQGTTGWEVAARFRPLDIDEPLLTFRCDPSDRPDQYPTFDITLLDSGQSPLAQHRCGGFRLGLDGVARGEFSLFAPLPETPPAFVRIAARPMGIKPVDETIPWSTMLRRQHVVDLEAASPVRLRVVDGYSGRPIVGAQAFVEGMGLTDAVADESGNLVVEGVPPMQWRMFAVAEGYGAGVVYLKLPYGKVATVKMNPGGKTLTGTVVDQNGTPLSGASVDVGYGGDYRPVVETNEQGQFTIVSLGLDRETISPIISCDGFVTQDNLTVPLKAGGPTKLRWALEPAATLSGTVVDAATGEPVPDAAVTVGTSRFGGNHPQTKTDADGRYVLSSLNSGTSIIHVISDHHAPLIQTVDVQQAQSTTLDFRISAGKPVTGIVTDIHGDPIAGVHLICDTWNQHRMFSRDTYTDSEGRYTLEHMPSTPAEIHVLKREFVSKRDLMVVGGDRADVELGPIITHKIVIRNEAGELVPGLKITQGYRWDARQNVSWQSSRYSVDRYYKKLTAELEIPVNDTSSYAMVWRFRATGFADETVEIPKNATEAISETVIMKPAPTVTAFVLDQETKQPLRDVAVALVSEEDRLRSYYVEYRSLWRYLQDGMFPGRYELSDSNGQVRLPIPEDPDNTALALVSSDGAKLLGLFSDLIPEAKDRATKDATINGGHERAELLFPKPATLRGRLTQAGEPLATERISIRQIIETFNGRSELFRGRNYLNIFGVSGELITDADGKFDFGGLGAGTYSVHRTYRFELPGGRSSRSIALTSQTVSLDEGQEGVVEVKLPPGQTVTGKAIDADGKPMAGCLVQLSRTVNGRIENYDATKSNPDGTFDFTHAPNGEWTVKAQHFLSTGSYSYEPNTVGDVEIVVANQAVTAEVILAPPEPAKPAATPGVLDRVLDFFGGK